MFSLSRAQVVALILLFGFCARGITYRAPLLDHHAWRQADTAAISRNFLRERFNPFFPQVDWRGAQVRGYVETGLEASAFIVAAASLPSHHFDPALGRILSTLAFLVSAWLIGIFARRRYGDTVAVVAVFFAAFGFPLALFLDRAFMNEPLLIALCVASLVLTQRLLDARRITTLGGLIVCTALVGAIKLPYLIVWAPIAGLAVERFGWRGLLRWELLLAFAVDLAAATAWYLHAHALGAETGLTFGLTDKLFDPALVFSAHFALHLARQLFKDLFGISLLFFVAGSVVAWRGRRLGELFGIGGYLAYLVILARGNDVHDYYQLPIVMIAPVVCALGLLAVSRALEARWHHAAGSISIWLMALVVVSTLSRSVSANSWYTIDPDLEQACAQSATFLRPNDRLVFPDNSDPKMLFCMDRKGWLLSKASSTGATLDEVKAEGASVAVVMTEAGATAGATWAAVHGDAIFQNSDVIAYRLTH